MVLANKIHIRKKYGSLLISLAFHVLFIALLSYWATALKDHPSPFSLPSSSKGPAKVSFQRFIPPQPHALPTGALQSAPLPAQLQPAQTPMQKGGARSSALPKKPPQRSIPRQNRGMKKSSISPAAPLKAKKSEAIRQPLPPSRPRSDMAQEQTVTQTMSPAPLMEPSSEAPQETAKKTPDSGEEGTILSPSEGDYASDPAPISSQAETAGSVTGSSRRPAVTGAALMNAFKRSFYAEQGAAEQGAVEQGAVEQGAVEPSTQEQDSFTSTGQGPAHVTERLREWDQASYRRKIRQALIRATHIHKKYITVPVFVHERLGFKLIINEEGRFKAEPLQSLTGIHEIDRYIEQFFSFVDMPPIPKRFGLKEFIHYITIELTLSPGGHFMELEHQ